MVDEFGEQRERQTKMEKNAGLLIWPSPLHGQILTCCFQGIFAGTNRDREKSYVYGLNALHHRSPLREEAGKCFTPAHRWGKTLLAKRVSQQRGWIFQATPKALRQEGLSDMFYLNSGRAFPKTTGRCIHRACSRVCNIGTKTVEVKNCCCRSLYNLVSNFLKFKDWHLWLQMGKLRVLWNQFIRSN